MQQLLKFYWNTLGDLAYHYLFVKAATKPPEKADVKRIVGDMRGDLLMLPRYMQILSDDLAAFLCVSRLQVHQ